MPRKSKKVVEHDVAELHPVYKHRNLMAAFFGKDSDVTVTVEFDADDSKSKPVFNVIVAGCEAKAEAMRTLLDGKFKLNDYTCTLLVNGKAKTHHNVVTPEVINAALTGNSIFSKLYIKYNGVTIDKWSLQLKPVVVYFPNDNFSSPNGMSCYTAEDLARYVLSGKINAVMMYSTDVGEYNGYWDWHLG